MKKAILVLICAILFLSAFSVFAESFVPEGWSESTVAEFEKRYGTDIGRFFGISDTSDFTAEKVIEYFNSRPGILADGYAVDENGIIVEASEIQKDEPEPIGPEPSADEKEVFGFTEAEQKDNTEEKPFPIALAVALAAVLAASFTVLVITRKKGGKSA